MNCRRTSIACFEFAIVLSLTMQLAGCEQPTATNEAGDAKSAGSTTASIAPKAPTTTDVRAQIQAAAPADFVEFLDWAEASLQEMPPSVALPAAAPVEPQWKFTRLLDAEQMRFARLDTEWRGEAQQAEALAALGPVSTSDRSTVVKPNEAGKPSYHTTIGGFRVNRDEVGAIEFEIEAPFGRYVGFQWSKAGQIPIPIKSNFEPFTLRVPTDDFAEWADQDRPRLDQVVLISDGMGDGDTPLVYKKIRFLSKASKYPTAHGVDRVRIGKEIRSAIFMRTPSTLAYRDVAIPAHGKLAVGLGMNTEATGGATQPVRFEVVIEYDGESTAVLNESMHDTSIWRDVSADLSRWAGQQVTVKLSATSEDPDALAFWANPIVYEPQEDPPVIVLYLIDTLAAEHMEPQGYARLTAPTLKMVADRGTWFARALSNSSRTIESIPDMMLGVTTERHDVWHNYTPAAEQFVTLAERLRDAGYSTVSFCTNVNAGPRQGMDQGFETFVDEIGFYWSKKSDDPTMGDRTVPLEKTGHWIDTHRDRPMFLYVHTAEPHAPYTPPQGYAGEFDATYKGNVDGTYGANGFSRRIHRQQYRKNKKMLRALQHVVALYDEEILYSDYRFALFLDQLSGKGLEKQTNLIVTSDHGEEFLQHGMWEHGLDLHNEQTRIPLILHGPAFVDLGEVEAAVQTVDIMPTILDVAGVAPPQAFDGDSLMPLVKHGAEPDDAAVARVNDRQIAGSNHNFRSSKQLIEFYLIDAFQWKILYGFRPTRFEGGRQSRWALFDIAQDPKERKNLLFNNQAQARKLIEDLLVWRLTHPRYDVATERGAAQLSGSDLQDLQALGYVGGDTSTDMAEEHAEDDDD